MRTLEKLGVYNALTDEIGFRGQSGIPQIFRYETTTETQTGTAQYADRQRVVTGKQTRSCR